MYVQTLNNYYLNNVIQLVQSLGRLTGRTVHPPTSPIHTPPQKPAANNAVDRGFEPEIRQYRRKSAYHWKTLVLVRGKGFYILIRE
jgi:hypothetical protein